MSDIIDEIAEELGLQVQESKLESSLCPKWLQTHFKGHDIFIPKITTSNNNYMPREPLTEEKIHKELNDMLDKETIKTKAHKPAEIQHSIRYNTDQVKVEFHVDIEIYKVFQELYLEDKEFRDYIDYLQNKLNKQKII